MKYLALLSFVFVLGVSSPTTYAQTDTGKSGKAGTMQCKPSAHEADSCQKCKEMGHGAAGHDGMMGHDGMTCRDGMGHDGAVGPNGMCRDNGDENCTRGRAMMPGCRMHFGGCGMIIHCIISGLVIIALILLVLLQIQWLRMISAKRKAAKLNVSASKDSTTPTA